jgi:hypothetical protein
MMSPRQAGLKGSYREPNPELKLLDLCHITPGPCRCRRAIAGTASAAQDRSGPAGEFAESRMIGLFGDLRYPFLFPF